jgi:hypothetical protein
VARTIHVSHAVRSRIGREDPLCVERILDSVLVPYMQIYIDSDVSIDGIARPRKWIYEGVEGTKPCSRLLQHYDFRHPSSRDRIWIERGHLDVGRHEVRIASSISLTDGIREIWSGSVVTTHAVDVQEESVRDLIWRVPVLSLAAAGVEIALSQETHYISMRVSASSPPAAVFLRLSLLDEKSTSLSHCTFTAAKGGGGGMGTSLNWWRLAPGRHSVRVQASADPDLALEESATVEEILDFPFRESFEVSGPDFDCSEFFGH